MILINRRINVDEIPDDGVKVAILAVILVITFFLLKSKKK